MSKQLINLGNENAGNGDPLRIAFGKINGNFTELYSSIGTEGNIPVQTGNGGKYLTTNGTTLSWANVTKTITSSTAPTTPNGGDLWWDTNSGRLYVYYGTSWVDASPVDGVGDSTDLSAVGQSVLPSTNLTYDLGSPTKRWRDIYLSGNTIDLGGTLINSDGSGGLSIPGGITSNGTLEFADGLTIVNGVIGKSSSETITEETIDGTISQTTTTESQIEIDDESIVIVKRATQVTDDTVVVTTDEAGCSITVNNSGVFIKKYAEPDGPNNTSYFQVRTNNGAILEAVQEDVADETYGRVIAAQGVVEIATRADGVEKNWGFNYDGTMIVPTNSTILGTNDLTIRTESDGNSGLFLNSNPLVGSAVLYATNNTVITADYDGNRKDWNFDKSGTITVPLLLPKMFTAVLDSEHFATQPGRGLVGTEWQYGIAFVVNPDGTVETQMDDPTYPENPGYIAGDVFRFTEADHGIPGYTFDITLNFTFDNEADLFVTNPAVSQPPEYPATVESLGAIKLNSSGQHWVFGTDGKLTVPGAIRKDGSLYLNSGGNTNSATVLVFGDTGSVILRTDDGTSNKSLTFDVTGKTSFPSSLEFSDGSTYDDSTLTGAIDSDLVLEVKHRPTVTAVATPASSSTIIVIDISENDDITVVDITWEVDLNPSGSPYWKTIAGTASDIPNNTYNILLTSFSGDDYNYPVTDGTTYTFRKIIPESKTWTIRSQTGGLVGPGDVIVTNETAPLGGGGTYRELAIELPTPDELSEQRWVFANDGDFTAPGDIFAGSFLGQTLEITDAGIVSSTYAGDLQTLHVAGALGKGLSLAVDGGLTSWLFKPNGTLTLPQYNLIESVGSNATISLNGVGSNESIIELATSVDNETITSTFAMHPAYGIDLTSVRDVAITAGYDEATAKRDAWQTAEQAWVTARDEDAALVAPDIRPWAGMPSYEAYTEIMSYPTPLSILAQAASTAKAAYELWQAEQAAIKVTITAKDNTWTFGNDGSLTFPNATEQTTAFTGSATSLVGGVHSVTVESSHGMLNIPREVHFLGDGSFPGIITWETADPGLSIRSTVNKSVFIDTNGGLTSWKFAPNGSVRFPDSTVQSTAYAPVTGQWTVTTGTNTYSFTVDPGATYVMWVRGTTDNGVISWNATVTITNTNLPAVGTSGAFVYTGGGTMLDFTAVPDRITTPTSGGVSRLATILGAPSTTFEFGINNASGASVTVYYGWAKI